MSTTWTDLLWTDLLGHAHTTRVRTEALDSRRLTVPRSVAVRGFGAGAAVDGPALVLAPDLESARPNPWQADTTIVFADLHEPDGTPSAFCGRSSLKHVLASLAAEGLRVSCAAELEFYLLDPATRQPVYPDIENYSITKGAEFEHILVEVRNSLRTMGVTIEASNPEYSGGQFEVNILHGPALLSADRAILLRSSIRALARRAGLEATFMAKPWTDQSGSGMHVHQSLWRGGENIFFDGHGLSAAGRHYVAGLLRRMPEQTLFGSPSANAYHRRNDYSFCPTVLCWGMDNRTLAVRAITGSPGSTRFEQRDAAAEASPYLVFAGHFAAGLEGMRDQLEPPAMTTGDAYADTSLVRLPRSIAEAHALLSGSAAARAGLGAATVEAYLAMLAPELDMVYGSSSDWERERYLLAL
ncbi:MAG: glutamine synthetase family protein [Chloroflexota bacterium]